MIGVNFQPGGGGGTNRTQQPGVQEAIKILSLRLPKTVGAQAVAPAPLLSSPGGVGSRVDSVVNSVLGKMFPTAAAPAPADNSFGMAPPPQEATPPSMPNFGGPRQQPGSQTPQTRLPADFNPSTLVPRVIAGGPVGDNPTMPGGSPGPQFPSFPGVDGGGGFPPAAIAPLPNWATYQTPSAPQQDYPVI